MLTPRQINEFKSLGLLKITRCIDTDTASRLAQKIWDFLDEESGVSKGDPNSWSPGHRPTGFQKLSRKGTFQSMASSRLCEAVDQLLGEGTSHSPTNWGIPLLVFPSKLDHEWSIPVGKDTWHVDAPPNGSLCHSIRAFVLLEDVGESQGPTSAVAGSSNLLRELRSKGELRRWSSKTILSELSKSDPWIEHLLLETNPKKRKRLLYWGESRSGLPLKVKNLTGKTGDAYLMDISTIHSKSDNNSPIPRVVISQTF